MLIRNYGTNYLLLSRSTVPSWRFFGHSRRPRERGRYWRAVRAKAIVILCRRGTEEDLLDERQDGRTEGSTQG